jgi:hypothetical protein
MGAWPMPPVIQCEQPGVEAGTHFGGCGLGGPG